MFEEFVTFVRALYQARPDGVIPLHAPRFRGNEQQYLADCVNSTYVSSVGEYVNRFEQMIAEVTGARFAMATVSGTSALHVALRAVGVQPGDLVITQSLTFVATGNAIRYQGADPLFVDIDERTLGLSAAKLETFLTKETNRDGQGNCIHRASGKRIAACVPMHTFGHPVEIDAIAAICQECRVPLVEDAAESLGSYFKGKHTGTFGTAGVFSFNGNKIITAGGGGAVVTDDEALATKVRHLTTQARVPHAWAYTHDKIGYNYRMPSLNAALACAQLEQLPTFLKRKRAIAEAYRKQIEGTGGQFFQEPSAARSNYWLNTILLNNQRERDEFLQYTNERGVTTRPVWSPLHQLPMFENCAKTDLTVTERLADRLVNVPSSAGTTRE